jgi:hypothetical protein
MSFPTLRSLRACAALAPMCASLAFAAPPASAPAAAADPAVRIRVALDDKGRLTVRYQAPPDVATLAYVDVDPWIDENVRRGLLKPADACGAMTGAGLTLRHGTECADGALFVATTRAVQGLAHSEPMQPASDGGVLVYTRYLAVAAPGRPLRWEFVAPAGGYVVDDGARHPAGVTREHAVPSPLPDGATRAGEAAIRAMHAAHYVYLGRSPVTEDGTLTVVRDPSLPEPLVAVVVAAARDAVAAYTLASGSAAGGPIGVVMLAAPKTALVPAGFNGDRAAGRMLRLSFTDPPRSLSADDAPTIRRFVSHEVAHEWNGGVFQSDTDKPWLHEGDSEWAAWAGLARAGTLPPDMLRLKLELAINRCLVTRGNAPAATMKDGWESRDDPYACGLALQFLAWARHPSDAGPLAAWGALHRRYPDLTAASFAAFADAAPDAPAPAAARVVPAAPVKARGKAPGGAAGKASTPAPAAGHPAEPSMTTLLLDPHAPFADTYLAALAARVPQLALATGEPDAADLRRGLVRSLFDALATIDCVGADFTVRDDDILIGRELTCRHMKPGKRVISIGGEPLLAHPRAAWRATAQACALHAAVTVGFSDALDEVLACPPQLPAAPRLVSLPPTALAPLFLLPAAR